MAISFTLAPVVSQVKVGTTPYYLKDQEARSNMANIQNDIDALYLAVGDMSSVQGVMKLAGKLSSTTTLHDGDTTPTVALDGVVDLYEAQHGDVVIDKDNHAEFVWIKTTPTSTANTGHWELIGDESLWVQKGDSITFTPATTNATLTIEGLNHTHSISSTHTIVGNDGKYQPRGSVTLSNNASTGDAINVSVESSSNVVTGITSSIILPTISSSFNGSPNLSNYTSTGSVTVTMPTSTITRVTGVTSTPATVLNNAYFTVNSSEVLELITATQTVVGSANAQTATFTVVSTFSTSTEVSVVTTNKIISGLPGINTSYETDTVAISSSSAKIGSSGTVKIKAAFTGTTAQFTTGEASPTTSITYVRPAASQTITI